ncbi:MAG: hypothetical protein B6U76_00325 [Desulfurococcales archaeon ex4484_217_2]|nr:MAG: hypothetical protein B6U76_00325 [Desulfurococcales archaeon ex4484_217_2]
MEKVLIIRGEHGNIIEEKIDETKDIISKVKELASRALNLWEPEFSDFIIIKDQYEVSLKLPLTKDQVQRFMKYGIRRGPDGYAKFNIPVYIISYDSIWVENDYIDRKVYLVSIYVNDEVKEDLKKLVIETTRGETARLRITEEELLELEE